MTPTIIVPTPRRGPNRLGLVLACGAIAVGLGLAVVIVAAGVYLYLRPRPAAGPAVEYILDSSPRMAAPAANDTGTRLAVAQGVLAEIVRPANPQVTAGLRVFGSGVQAQGCQDTDLVVPLAPASQGQISTHLLTLLPGPNPAAAMAEAMISAIRDLAPTTGPHSLVVVTGGDDSCNPEAGQLIAAEAKRAGITLQLFVVGYQVPDDQGQAIKGLVDDAGSGAYINTRSKAELTQVLEAIQDYVDSPGSLSPADVLATATAAAPTPTATETPAPPATAIPAATATPPSITLLDAAQLVLDQVVMPASLGHDAIVFAWPEPLVPGDLLQPYPLPGPTPAPIPTPIGARSWFFWVDDVPVGKFAHQGRFVLVDMQTGVVTAFAQDWWPMLNGQGLWVEFDDYWNPDDWVFSSLTWRPASGRPPGGLGGGLNSAAASAPAQGAAMALVVNGWQAGQPGLADFAADAAGMSNALALAGARVTYLGPAADANAGRSGEATRDNIVGWFKQAAGALGRGSSAVVYITAHGTPDGGPLAGLSAADLAGLLGQLAAGVDVSVVLDGSYSGAFIEPLKPVVDMIIAATDGQTAGFFDIDPPGDPNIDDRGSEFTSGLAVGMVQARGARLAERLRAAFGTAVKLDAAAQSGKTRPLIWPEQAPPTPTPPPTFTPTPTDTPTATPTPTPVPVRIYVVRVTLLADQAEQAGLIKMPTSMELSVQAGTANFSGPAPWVAVNGEVGTDGSFKAFGSGTVAGIEDVAVAFEGQFVGGRLTGQYTMGTDGRLLQEQPVIYEVIGGTQSPISARPAPYGGRRR